MILALRLLKSKGKNSPTLIFCPMSCLRKWKFIKNGEECFRRWQKENIKRSPKKSRASFLLLLNPLFRWSSEGRRDGGDLPDKTKNFKRNFGEGKKSLR